MCTFAVEIPRGGAVVARWAHNPKVVSSSLAPATKQAGLSKMAILLLFLYHDKAGGSNGDAHIASSVERLRLGIGKKISKLFFALRSACTIFP